MTAVTHHRAVIVDDERLARQDLATELREFPSVEIVGQAATAAEAESMIAQLHPDLVFLDICLPDASGFDVLTRLPVAPKIIFVTAFERFAMRAFEVNAIDYLLKPVDTARLGEALRRLESPSDIPSSTLDLTDQYYAAIDNFRGFIAVRTIRRLQAEGNYTVIHTTDGRHFEIKQSLQAWERRLPANIFVRINRNEIVQTGHITRLMPSLDGGYQVELTGEPLPRKISRRNLSELRTLLVKLGA